MTLQDFKDQVAREWWSENRLPVNDAFPRTWESVSPEMSDFEIDAESDRAAELYAKEREKAAYKDGYRMGWDNRGLPDFLNTLTTPYKENEYSGGYAPGSYMCKCSTCGCEFFGDKRAVKCLPCASGLSSAAITPPAVKFAKFRLEWFENGYVAAGGNPGDKCEEAYLKTINSYK